MTRSRALAEILLAFLICILSIPPDLSAQGEADSVDVLQAQAPRVYIDCQQCDQDYIRTEMTFANYVRDRKLADIHALITTRSTAGGGKEYTVTFIGQNASAGMNDTLTFTTNSSDTDDIVRSSLVRVLKVGLARHVARTPLGQFVSVTYKRPKQTSRVVDKWDYWVFRTSLNSNLNGEKSQGYTNLYGSFSAKRITRERKIKLSIGASYDESRFDYGSSRLLSVSRSRYFDSYVVESLGDHWSAGGFAEGWASTYSNIRFKASVTPAVEYNIFPYEQSTRHQLRILYGIGYENASYVEETIFDRKSEQLFTQTMSASLELTQPWGTISTSLDGSHYLHDVKKRRLSIWTKLSLRLLKGFSLNLQGGASKIGDQLSLRKGTATPEEVLLRRTQLATSYSYWSSAGLTYTFGSIYNNIVNPRFGD